MRLLKHNWWDPLYGRIRTHSDVFFDFTFNENSSLYDYINRASPEFQLMHVYDQQLCPLFHRCGSLFLFLNSWRWIVSKSSNEIDHHRSLSKPRENQNTIEKNEFYEWKIWRTIMKTMNENNFICIKINSWFQYDKVPSAFLFIKRFFFYQSLFFYHHLFQQLALLPDLIRSNGDFVSTHFYHRSHTDQHFNSWFLEINENSVSISFYHRFIQINIWSTNFFVATKSSLASSSINR